jgi:hypothetical protein
MPTDTHFTAFQRSESQRLINETYRAGEAHAALGMARALADFEHVDFPQYDGFWDDWGLAEATSDLVSKGGQQAQKGDVVLYKHVPGLGFERGTASFYSVRLGWNCSAPYGMKEIEVMWCCDDADPDNLDPMNGMGPIRCTGCGNTDLWDGETYSDFLGWRLAQAEARR